MFYYKIKRSIIMKTSIRLTLLFIILLFTSCSIFGPEYDADIEVTNYNYNSSNKEVKVNLKITNIGRKKVDYIRMLIAVKDSKDKTYEDWRNWFIYLEPNESTTRYTYIDVGSNSIKKVWIKDYQVE